MRALYVTGYSKATLMRGGETLSTILQPLLAKSCFEKVFSFSVGTVFSQIKFHVLCEMVKYTYLKLGIMSTDKALLRIFHKTQIIFS